MTDEDIKKYIDLAVERTVKALRKNTAVRTDDTKYNEVSYMLTSYYQNGESVPELDEAVANVSRDKYFDIIPLYYRDGKKIEMIAEQMGVDTSTVVRNKRRLCMDIYVSLIG